MTKIVKKRIRYEALECCVSGLENCIESMRYDYESQMEHAQERRDENGNPDDYWVNSANAIKDRMDVFQSVIEEIEKM